MKSMAISKDSYTTQVVKKLKHEIESGALPPLSKLASTRELAARFNVSKTVIMFALDALEKQRLIHREERRGVFVSEMASNPEVLEVLIFVFGVDPNRHAFANRILSVITSKAAQGHISFFTRYVTLKDFHEYPPKYLSRLLEAEISKLSQTFHSDCAILIGPAFSRDDIEVCMKLPFPSMFVGNFKDGDYEDLPYNRLGFAANYYDASVEFAHKKHFKSILLIVPDLLQNLIYFRDALERMNKLASDYGVNIESIFVPDVHNVDRKTRLESFRKTARLVKAKCLSNALITMDCMVEGDRFVEFMKEEGLCFEKGKLELVISSNLANDLHCDAIRYQTISETELEKFNGYFCQMLHKLAAGTMKNHREDYTLENLIK